MDGATEGGNGAKEEPSGPDSAAIQVEPGVWVSPFDYSVDNFFASMDSILALCGATGEENFDGGELQRFSSMITFLKEWKQFHYEPKTIRFAHATESERVKDATGGISLSQFSSATVPKIEQLANEVKCSGSNDFILHAGGPVWALDWCPRIHEKAGCNVKCEYLAVASHPPGSTYHKIGMPLVGRGVIQIWCFLNLEEKVELPPARHRMRGRSRKMPVKEEPAFDSKGKELSVTPTARGRPRKRPLVIVDDPDGQKEVKPRGRPRKRLLPDLNDLDRKMESPSSCNNPIPSVNECLPPSNVDFGRVALAMPVPIVLDGRDESSVSRGRGRPRKKPISCVDEFHSPACGVELVKDLSALSIVSGAVASSQNGEKKSRGRPRGRPRKKQLPCVSSSNSKMESPSSGNYLSMNECTPPLNVGSGEIALTVPVSTDLDDRLESFVPRRRGRPRKKPFPIANECCISASTDKLEKASSVLPASKELVALSENAPISANANGEQESLVPWEIALTMPVSTDLDDRVDSSVPRHRGRPRKKPIPIANECCIPASSERLEKGSSALPTSKEHVTLGENVMTLTTSADANEKQEALLPKHRGRPRKKSIPGLGECVPVEPSNASDAPLTARGLETLSEGVVALPISVDLEGKMESFVPEHAGRPKNKPISSMRNSASASHNDLMKECSRSNPRGLETLSESCVASSISTNLNGKMKSSVPKRRGRPRKTQVPHLGDCFSASAGQLRGDSSVLPFSREHVTLSEDYVAGRCQTDRALAVKSREDFNYSMVTNKFGSSTCIEEIIKKDKAKAVANDSIADHAIHINKNELSATAFSENWENVDSLTCQTDNGVTAELCEGLNIIPLATDPTTCVHSRSKEEKARAFSHLNSTSPRLSTTNEQNHKEMAVTLVPTHDSKDMDQKCSISKDTTLPRVVFCLAHNGKVAWDVKWRPYSINNSEGKQHMGYLAVLLGNGSLEVWEVPVPSMVKILYSGRTEGTDPRFLKLEPVFRCSKVKCGDRQSIPLTVEWSPSSPCDLILAGCHDGMVALWKFTTEHSSEDSKPLLCFSADSVPIRALAWAPEDDTEGANVIVTAGHDGIKFWDIRDPYHPLWDYSPVQRFVLSLDWLKDPGCIILSLDDGTLRMISLLKAAHDLPVTGEPFSGAKQPGLHTCPCSHFAIWNVQVSRATGIVAYCTAEGSVCRFQLTAKAVEKDASRYRMPHFLCGSLTKEGQVLEINTPPPDVPLQNIPLQIKKLPKEFGDSPRTLIDFSDRKISRLSNPSAPGDDWTPKDMKTSSKSRKNYKANPTPPSDRVFSTGETDEGTLESTEHKQDGSKQDVVEFPPKLVAMHRVRWNMNKGSERWLCYGGAAGIIRCQEIPY